MCLCSFWLHLVSAHQQSLLVKYYPHTNHFECCLDEIMRVHLLQHGRVGVAWSDFQLLFLFLLLHRCFLYIICVSNEWFWPESSLMKARLPFSTTLFPASLPTCPTIECYQIKPNHQNGEKISHPSQCRTWSASSASEQRECASYIEVRTGPWLSVNDFEINNALIGFGNSN